MLLSAASLPAVPVHRPLKRRYRSEGLLTIEVVDHFLLRHRLEQVTSSPAQSFDGRAAPFQIAELVFDRLPGLRGGCYRGFSGGRIRKEWPPQAVASRPAGIMVDARNLGGALANCLEARTKTERYM